MRRDDVLAAKKAAKEFIRRVDAVIEDEGAGTHYFYGSPQTGALRRQSMELTRALAAMRKS